MDLGSGGESREEVVEAEAEEEEVPSLPLPSDEFPSETSVSAFTCLSLSASACLPLRESAADLLALEEGGGLLCAGVFFAAEDLLRALGGGHPTIGCGLPFFAGWFLMEPRGSERLADDEAEGAGTADEEEGAGTADDAAEGVAAEDGVGAGAEVEEEGTAVAFFFFLPFADASVFVFITNQICNNWE